MELSPLGEPIGFVELFAPGRRRARWSPRRRDEEAHAKEALYELLAMEAEVRAEPVLGLLDLEVEPREDAPAEERMGPVSVEAVSELFDQEEQHLARLVEGYSAGLFERHHRAHLLAGLGTLCLFGFVIGFPLLVGDTTPLEVVANLIPSICAGALVASVELRLFFGEDKASRGRKRIEEARAVIVTDNGRVHLGLLVENPAKTRR
ncbi:MAG: hypothetical protein ACYCTL_10620 [Acidimicrobiales bacterium]